MNDRSDQIGDNGREEEGGGHIRWMWMKLGGPSIEGKEGRRGDWTVEQDRDRAVCASLPYTRIEYASH